MIQLFLHLLHLLHHLFQDKIKFQYFQIMVIDEIVIFFRYYFLLYLNIKRKILKIMEND